LEVGRIFGQVLRLARKEAGLTQEQLAFEAGVQRNYISFLERGIHEPTLGMIIQLSRALGCSATTLISNVEAQLRPTNGSEQI